MNWDMVAALAAVSGVVISGATAIYFYGRMSKGQEILAQLVAKHDERLDRHEEKLQDHGEKLASLGARI